MNRPAVSILILCLAFLVVLWLAPDVPLIVFAGILMAVFLRSGGDWISSRTGLSPGYGLGLFFLALIALALAFFAFAAPALGEQFSELWGRLPEALQSLRGYIDRHAWLKSLVERADIGAVAPSSTGAISTVSTTFGALANFVVILFVGLYGAISPRTYEAGFLALLAPSLRPKARMMLLQAAVALRAWLFAQFVAMAIVGVLTGLGLWLLGVPLAPILGVLAGLLTFIPNIGPVLAAIPALLLALTLDGYAVLWVAAVYIGVQTVESYLITPRLQEEAVSLPPALTIAVQLLLGLLFGVMGLALATPIAAVALRLLRRFYVREYLDQEPEASPKAAALPDAVARA